MRIVVVLLLCTLHARAGEPSKPSEVKRFYDEGTAAFNLGDFPAAIASYKAAYKLKPDPVFLYNLGQSYRLANDFPQALFFYRSYIRNAPNAPNRKEVEGRIRVLEKTISEQKSPPNSQLEMGATTTARPPVTDEPSVTEHTEPAPAEPAPVQKPAPAPEVKPVAAKPNDRAVPVYKKWWLWTAVGGVVVVGVAVGLGVGLSQNPLPDTHFGTTTVFALHF